ncbi:MAG: polyphenol oxidase family protein [Acidimicrobiales bacterium]
MTWPVFDSLPLDVIVTTRSGGVSSGDYASLNLGLHVGDSDDHVIENRSRAAAAIGTELSDLVFATQVHGRAVHVVTTVDMGRGAATLATAVQGVDAFVTAQAGPVLVMMVADCVPAVLYDPLAHVLACVHTGWRGTTSRVLDAALSAMTDLGAQPTDVIAGIGPAANPATYEVGLDVTAAVTETFGATGAARLLGPGRGDRRFFDLPAANYRILLEAGVPARQIHVAPVTTSAGGPFYSDRATRPCGRFAILGRLHSLTAAG